MGEAADGHQGQWEVFERSVCKVKVCFFIHDVELIQHIVREKVRPDIEYQFFTDREDMLVHLAVNSCHSVVLSDRHGSFAELCEFIELIKEHHQGQFVLLISNRHDHQLNRKVMKYCLAHHISYIHPGLSIAQIVAALHKQWFHDEHHQASSYREIVLFIGSTPNIGTTVVAYTTAQLIAQQTTAQIAYLCLNLKSSKIHRYLGFDRPPHSLDDMRADIKAQSLSAEKLKTYATPSSAAKNLHVFMGNMAREQAEFYTIEDVHHLLQCAADAYDLCIVDVNAYWDNAATISGLLSAEHKVVVSTAELSHFQEDLERWMQNMAIVYPMERSSFDLFITQLDKTSSAHKFKIREIRKETGMNIIGTMAKDERVSTLLNEGLLPHMTTKDRSLTAGMAGVASMLIALYELNRLPVTAKKSWFTAPKLLGG